MKKQRMAAQRGSHSYLSRSFISIALFIFSPSAYVFFFLYLQNFISFDIAIDIIIVMVNEYCTIKKAGPHLSI
ncbi:hypothetical protein [Cytobacillus massiliigabonensis]|uniref:hypothetical protein n=1 Tax=Cytobacillus massiliigabonensis TaxID=1871011 RepID=UPI000C8314A7|nr:hypothetical protein [Cytobacillus massiliigabonensis]